MGCLSDMDENHRGKLGAIIAGTLSGVGWWLFIDAAAYSAHIDSEIKVDFVKYLPGIGSTVGLFMINAMDWEALNADESTYKGDCVSCKARSFLLFALAIMIASLVGAIVIFTGDYEGNEYDETIWPGIAILLQSILIFLSAIIMKLFNVP